MTVKMWIFVLQLIAIDVKLDKNKHNILQHIRLMFYKYTVYTVYLLKSSNKNFDVEKKFPISIYKFTDCESLKYYFRLDTYIKFISKFV